MSSIPSPSTSFHPLQARWASDCPHISPHSHGYTTQPTPGNKLSCSIGQGTSSPIYKMVMVRAPAEGPLR